MVSTYLVPNAAAARTLKGRAAHFRRVACLTSTVSLEVSHAKRQVTVVWHDGRTKKGREYKPHNDEAVASRLNDHNWPSWRHWFCCYMHGGKQAQLASDSEGENHREDSGCNHTLAEPATDLPKRLGRHPDKANNPFFCRESQARSYCT